MTSTTTSRGTRIVYADVTGIVIWAVNAKYVLHIVMTNIDKRLTNFTMISVVLISMHMKVS